MSGYQLFPNLTADEYEALRADIAERGVMVPVELDETGAILDGHHRAAIADKLGIGYRTIVREGWTEEAKLVHIVALNAHRRQLRPEDRAEIVARLRRERLSTRTIARAVGVGVGTVHRDLSRVPSGTPDAITGADGRTYPSRRPSLPPLPADVKRGLDAIADMPEVRASAERARWASLLAASARVLNEGRPVYWIDRLDPDERRRALGHVRLVRAWADDWETALVTGVAS